MRKPFPAHGVPWATIKEEMTALKAKDADWRGGRLPFHVWYGGDDIFEIQKQAYTEFMQENGLGAGKSFFSLGQMEREVIEFSSALLNGPDAVGHITSGGSESIFVAMKAARDWARVHRPVTGVPEVLAPYSVHPTFNRAAEYLCLKIVRVPVGSDFRADPTAMASAVTQNTIAIVGSAPCFPYGVIDPIADLAEIARSHGLWMHVDACIGGYSAPFAKKLGYPIPPFDFAVDGVTSISADLHKYGFSAKGASTVLYRNQEFERYQPFDFEDWPQGRFSNPNICATRPGGAIAAAWAVLKYLGEDGFLKLNKRLMAMRQRYIDGINAIDGLHVRAKPHVLLVAYGSERLNMGSVADEMVRRGWYVGRQARPPGIVLGLSLPHEAATEPYLRDLKEAVNTVVKGKALNTGAPTTAY
jgi:glutamate/tyrosine decarboxylase-like PLP-dependent enzyme